MHFKVIANFKTQSTHIVECVEQKSLVADSFYLSMLTQLSLPSLVQLQRMDQHCILMAVTSYRDCDLKWKSIEVFKELLIALPISNVCSRKSSK